MGDLAMHIQFQNIDLLSYGSVIWIPQNDLPKT